jgi:hypothetical protein
MTDTISRQAVIDAIASVLSKGERPFSPVAPLLTAINAIPSQPTQSDALKIARDAIRGLLDITSEYNLDSEQAGRAYAALHEIGTALAALGQSK